MVRLVLLMCCLLRAGTAFCQFNDSIHYRVSYAATGTINRATEGRSYVLNNAFNFDVNKKYMSLNNSNSWVYGEANGKKNLNDFSSSLNFDINRAIRTWYFWGLASYTTSYSLRIRGQFQAGGGIGHNTIRKPQAELVISDGILFERSNLYDAADEKKAAVLARNSLRIKYRFVIGKTVVIDGMHFWQPALSDFNDYIVRSTNGLSVNLNKWLSITTSLAYNRFNQTGRENLLINFGLTAQKYF